MLRVLFKSKREYWLASIVVALFFCPETVWGQQYNDDDIIYRFPNAYNPNPIGGRLFVQPMDGHDDQVVMGLSGNVSLTTASEFNRSFHDGSSGSGPVPRDVVNPDLLLVNSYIVEVQLGYGFRIKGYKVEAGALIRTHIDTEESEMSIFLAEVHRGVFPSPNHIPADDQPYNGTVGEKRTVVIAKNGQVFITTAQLYAKIQLLEEERLSWIPNLSFKWSVRVPTSSHPFDRFGTSITFGLSKHLTDWIVFLASASISFQDLEARHFDATNLKVYQFYYDLFAGLVVDLGDPGGFYAVGGFRFSSLRMRYENEPTSATTSSVVHLSFNYLSASGNWELYFYLSEEIPGVSYSLEPDFLAGLGLAFRLGARGNPEEVAYHE